MPATKSICVRRLCGRHARLQAADGIQHPCSSLIGSCDVLGKRYPQFDCGASARNWKPNGATPTTVNNMPLIGTGPPQDSFVAGETAHPQAMAEDHDVFPVSSSARKARPSSGCTRTSANRSHDTISPTAWMAGNESVSVNVASR